LLPLLFPQRTTERKSYETQQKRITELKKKTIVYFKVIWQRETSVPLQPQITQHFTAESF